MLPKTVYVRDTENHVAHHERLRAEYAVECLPELLPANQEVSAPRPDERPADQRFPGDFTGQLEHVWIEGETYSYAEHWRVGVAGDWSLMPVGWDWKVGCRMHECRVSDETTCCYQECVDGGDSGLGYEAPDRFGCMNGAVGGEYQWFVDGLRDAGVPGLEACR